MSDKLQIGDTLNEAFMFGLKRWGAILRFSWVPILITGFVIGMTIVSIFDTSLFTADAEDVEITSLQEAMRMPVSTAIVFSLAVYAFVALMFSGVMASIFRLVALGEDRPGIFHLRLDGPAVRVFISYVIMFILNGMVWGAALAAALAMNGQSFGEVMGGLFQFFQYAAEAEEGQPPDPEMMNALMEPMKGFFLATMFAFIPLIYLNIKLAPFPAGTAAENRLILIRSFALTSGHFWSIFGAYFLLILMLIAVSIIFQIVLALVQGITVLLGALGGPLVVVGALFGIVIFLSSLFFNLFVAGVQLSFRAIIYRRLATGE